MAIVIQPTFTSQCDIDDSGKKVWTRNFVLKDDGDSPITPEAAWAAAENYAKANKDFDDVHAKSVQLQEESEGASRVYRFTIKYTIDGDLGGDDSGGQIVYGTLRFSTKGGSSHINNSISTNGTYTSRLVSEGAPNFHGLINVQNGVAAGVDIQTPVLHIDVTCKMPTALIAQRISTFYNLTGKVNSDALWGYPAHTLLFRGLDGNTDGVGTCSLTFSFDFQPNITDQIDPFESVSKKGWEYAWVYSELKTDNTTNTTIPQPVGLYIEQVYPETSFQPFQFIHIR
ncbi:MAG: hypothetical protein IJG38_04960 [Thermoguttaceae bacterium]|nr:hypothetical protein [Thermoguttaceae bacterium]